MRSDQELFATGLATYRKVTAANCLPLLDDRPLKVGVPGKVVIRTVVETEDRLLRETLGGERVDVERVPIDRVVDVAPVVRTEGDVTIIPIVEERLVIERQLVLVEELRLHRHATTEAMEVPITLRRQRAVVERVDDAGSPVTEAQGWAP